ncbi:MAG: outer membrane protein assembly factor BamD [Bacteroidales bacterium]
MKRVSIGFLSLTVAVVLFSCKSQYEQLLKSTDANELYQGAFDYYNNGKYVRSANLFEKLLLVVRGTERYDTVQFHLAMSNYRFGDYSLAETNFDEFISIFPRSPFTEEARYLKIKCSYYSTHRPDLDQIPSQRTLSAIDIFKFDFPNSAYIASLDSISVDLNERLDRKSLENAKLYYTIEDYKAASYALKNTLKENSENIYREEILYYIVLSNYKYALNSIPEKQRERFLNLVDEYYSFVSEFPTSKYRKEVDKMNQYAQNFLKK